MADFHANGRAPNCMIKLKIIDNGLAKLDANILYNKGGIPSGPEDCRSLGEWCQTLALAAGHLSPSKLRGGPHAF